MGKISVFLEYRANAVIRPTIKVEISKKYVGDIPILLYVRYEPKKTYK